MIVKSRWKVAFFSGIFAAGIAVGYAANRGDEASLVASAEASQPGPVYELRTYTTHPGRLDALHARFREHTMRIFEKHGMSNVAYWVPQDDPESANTLIYVISHASREQAKKNWEAFSADPEWKQVYEASVADGKIVSKVESVFMDATDYSPAH